MKSTQNLMKQLKKILIINKYLINSETFAILPARQIEYNTIVLERIDPYSLKKHPLRLLNEHALLRLGQATNEYTMQLASIQDLYKKYPSRLRNTQTEYYSLPTHQLV